LKQYKWVTPLISGFLVVYRIKRKWFVCLHTEPGPSLLLTILFPELTHTFLASGPLLTSCDPWLPASHFLQLINSSSKCFLILKDLAQVSFPFGNPTPFQYVMPFHLFSWHPGYIPFTPWILSHSYYLSFSPTSWSVLGR
jgi:hypothetical protein